MNKIKWRKTKRGAKKQRLKKEAQRNMYFFNDSKTIIKVKSIQKNHNDSSDLKHNFNIKHLSETMPQTKEDTHTARPLSALISEFVAYSLTRKTFKIIDILTFFEDRGLAMLLLLFALPMALPVPVPPGINIVLASPLIFLTLQQVIGRHHVWLPQKIKNKNLKPAELGTLFAKTISPLQKVELLSKPRLTFLTIPALTPFWGLLGFIMALTVCIPFPLTNTIPSFGIALMAFGGMMRDGIIVLCGALIGSAWVILLVTMTIIFGAEAVDIIKDFIKSVL